VPLHQEAPDRATAKRENGADARDEEEEGHSPFVEKGHGKVQCRKALGVLDVKAPGIEDHPGVEEMEHEDGEDAQPVEVVTAKRGRDGDVGGHDRSPERSWLSWTLDATVRPRVQGKGTKGTAGGTSGFPEATGNPAEKRGQYLTGREKCMQRTTRWLVGTVALAVLVPGPVASPSEPTATIPDLSGRWKLDKAQSDDARRKMREEVGRRGEARSGGPGGSPEGPQGGGAGPAGGEQPGHEGSGGPPGSGEGRSPDDTMRAVFDPPEEFAITVSTTEVQVEAVFGDLRIFRPNGKKVKAENGTVERVAAWKEDALVVETKSRAGAKVHESWSVSDDGKRLTIVIRVEGGMGPKLDLRRVYDRQPSAE
jgi:hypothetical protein